MIAKGAADIVKAGGRVGIGGHGQMQGIGVHWEIWAMQSGGMSNHDTLRVATIFGAEAIGLAAGRRLDRSGKLADLIMLDKNPLDRYPQHEHDPLGDEERRAVRRRHAQPDLADAKSRSTRSIGGTTSPNKIGRQIAAHLIYTSQRI